MAESVMIYTDGACSGNPGRGGWCAILSYKGKEKVLYGGKEDTTNNHMELLAVVSALNALKSSQTVTVVSDSKYVCDAINKQWLYNWAKGGSIDNRPNGQLWKELLLLITLHDVTFEWVKGHDGHLENERCDKIASAIAQGKESVV